MLLLLHMHFQGSTFVLLSLDNGFFMIFLNTFVTKNKSWVLVIDLPSSITVDFQSK